MRCMQIALLLAATAVRCVHSLDMSQCIAPLGMESGQIPNTDITASSCYNDGNVAPENGRLNQEIKGGAWCPRSQIYPDVVEWLQVDLHTVHVLTAVSTQGRFGNGQGQEYAETFILEYYRPRLGKWVRYRTHSGEEILTGNTNTYLMVKTQLVPAVWATKIRFLPYSIHRRTVCMRVEVYGCPWNAGIVSYSMPAGEARSNGIELSDATYDGSWSGGHLRNGLGQLVDGEFGGDDIREATRVSPWVGWRNESRVTTPPGSRLSSIPRPPPVITFEFDRVREFNAVHIFCNNKFMRDVQVFSSLEVRFSVGGKHYQEEAVRYAHTSDNIFEHARNVSIKLHHRIGRWLRLEFHFAARWMLVSEVVFDSDVAQGNHSTEIVVVAGSGHAGGAAGAERGGGGAAVSTVRHEDPLYVVVAVGVITALAILVAVAVFLVVHRHRHRKCFASALSKDAVTSPAHRPAQDNYSACGTASACSTKGMFEDYQEPYQALPYATYSPGNLEMTALNHTISNAAQEESCNYEYAVPEVSSAPLLQRMRFDTMSTHREPSPLSAVSGSGRGSGSGSGMDDECMAETAAVRRRLAGPGVPELPRHRLRMISKLAEGVFGSVYVAEADGVPEYEGGMKAEKKLVAVKFLGQDASRDERCAFERDVRILAALAHPCLARVVGLCHDGPLAVVLEYLPGGNLCAHLRTLSAPPPPDALLAVALQLASGMRYLEALDFVHRDLAARNCLIGPAYQIKIGDFGTDNEAYACDYCSLDGRLVPLRWAAPEAALDGHHSTRADVWSFAVTLHEVFSLCRRRPFERLSDEAVAEALRTGSAEPAERAQLCPRPVFRLMRDCWRREPTCRPSFRDVHQRLQRAGPSPSPPL